MRLIALKLTLVSLVVFFSHSPDSHAADKIKVGFASLTGAYMDHLVAIQKGFYREEGLEVEVIRGSGGVTTPALMSGQLDFTTSAGSALSAILKGAGLKVVYTNLSKPTYSIWSNSPEIKTIKDLVGKRIGINAKGDTNHLSMLLLFKKHGIEPNSVRFISLQKSGTRFAAFKSGSIDATLLTPADELALSKPKGHKLAVVADEIQLVWNGVAVAKKTLDEKAQLVERFLRGAVKGREYARRHKEQTLDIIGKYDKSSRQALLADYEGTLVSMTSNGTVSEEVRIQEIAVRSEILGLSDPPKSGRVFDYSVVERIYADFKSKNWAPKP